jgi:hypothetical protein
MCCSMGGHESAAVSPPVQDQSAVLPPAPAAAAGNLVTEMVPGGEQR